MFKPFVPPIKYEEAKEQAIEILTQMTLDEKVSMIVGHNMSVSYTHLTLPTKA